MTDTIDHLDLTTLDIEEEKRQELLRLFPEIRTEGGKIDFERLKLALGEAVDAGKERYGMNWPGKADCFKTIQLPSVGTLLPSPAESVNFDTTENLIIEGDNLEVLKLLQKAYLGKVKMIYIDPPYNTGNDFIYPDNYAESLQTYLQYTGQVDAEGKKFGTNTDTDGRFHSKWLNMMYPRLYLARNLLREDGVIFISIDDNEASNLRRLCDEIFGEENRLSVHNIQVRYGNKSLNERKDFQELLEYVLIYAKNKTSVTFNKPQQEYPLNKFNFVIQHSDTPSKRVKENGRDVDIWTPGSFDITASPTGSIDRFKETWISGSILSGTGHGVMYTKVIDKRRAEDGDGCLYRIHGIGEDGLGYRYYTNPTSSQSERGKMYTKVPTKMLEEIKKGTAFKENPIINFYDFSADFGNIRHEGGVAFNSGKKPVKMIRQFISYLSGNDFLVLDFFSGSASTAHAVMLINAEDGGSRKHIQIQLPEPTDDEEALKGGYKTIVDITKARVRNAGEKIKGDFAEILAKRREPLDVGFRVYKLAESSFRPWNADIPRNADALGKQLELHIEHIRDGRSAEDILYEILLKSGFPLTTSVETLTMVGKTVYSVANGALFICLERDLTLELIRAMAEQKPERVVCLDEGFAGNDQLKTNAVQIFKTKGVTSFKTV